MKPCWLTVLFVAVACGGKSTAQQTTPPPTPVVAESDATCPLEVPGTSLSVEDTANGAALVFVTTGDVVSVRSRAAKLAEVHNQHDGDDSAFGMMFSPGSKATASEIPGGARVELAAAQADGAAAIQSELRMHAGHLSGATSCKM